MKLTALASHFPKRWSELQLHLTTTLLTSNGNVNHFDLHEMLFITLCISKFDVSTELTSSGVNLTAKSSGSTKVVVRSAVQTY